MDPRQPTIWALLSHREVADWIRANQEEVDRFQSYLRTLNPYTWQQEFAHVILECAGGAEGDELAEAIVAR
jgi:hypothetical protein